MVGDGKCKQMNKVVLKQNLFGRWILVSAQDEEMAWSGSQFVGIDPTTGMPTNDVQVSNFATRDHAALYAEEFDLEVIVV
jgi:hypothetical protein